MLFLLYHLFQVYYTKYPFSLCHLCLYPLLYSKGIFHDASLCINFLQRGRTGIGDVRLALPLEVKERKKRYRNVVAIPIPLIFNARS